MKHLAITLSFTLMVLAGSFSFTQAQKFESGDNNLELQFTPFNQNQNPLGINGIRFRHFNSESSALRLNFDVGFSSNTDIVQQEDSDNDVDELEETTTNFNLDIRPGYEFHMEGTDRLSPYFGGELVVELNSTSVERETQPQPGDDVETVTVSNGQAQVGGQQFSPGSGFFRLGLNGVAGVDYYFVDNLYLGAELGYGLSYISESDVTVEATRDGVNTPDDRVRGNNFSIGSSAQGSIRLGYLF